MKTRGDAGWERLPSFLNKLVPRVLDFLGKRERKTKCGDWKLIAQFIRANEQPADQSSFFMTYNALKILSESITL